MLGAVRGGLWKRLGPRGGAWRRGLAYATNAVDGLKDYESVVEVPVKWGDMDAFAHLNNVHYVRYFETARIHHFTCLGLTWQDMRPEGDDFDMEVFLNGQATGPILASTSVRYLAPATFPDTLLVASTNAEVGEDRILMKYAAWSRKLNRLVADGDGLVVVFDYKANRKAAVPPQLVQAIDTLKETPRAHRMRVLERTWEDMLADI